jgi:hypothetical protein
MWPRPLPFRAAIQLAGALAVASALGLVAQEAEAKCNVDPRGDSHRRPRSSAGRRPATRW